MIYSPDFDAELGPSFILPSVESVVSMLSVQRADFDAELGPISILPSVESVVSMLSVQRARGLYRVRGAV